MRSVKVGGLDESYVQGIIDRPLHLRWIELPLVSLTSEASAVRLLVDPMDSAQKCDWLRKEAGYCLLHLLFKLI